MTTTATLREVSYSFADYSPEATPHGRPIAARNGCGAPQPQPQPSNAPQGPQEGEDDTAQSPVEDEYRNKLSPQLLAEVQRHGLLHSVPLDVYRHTDFSEFKEIIGQVIDEFLCTSRTNPQTQQNQGTQPASVGNVDEDGSRVLIDRKSFPPLQAINSSIPINHSLELLGFRGVAAQSNYQKLRKHLRIVLLDAFVRHAYDPTLWISYSRNDSSFIKQISRYNKLHLSREFLCAAIDRLVSAGILEGWKQAQGERGLQSRFRATATLVARLDVIPVAAITHDYSSAETIILKGIKDPVTGKAKRLEYDDDETDGRSAQWRHNLALINQRLEIARIDIDLTDEEKRAAKIDLQRKRIHRVFNNGSWGEGGRFYGGWWLSVRNRVTNYRQRITIEGQQTVEVDYSQIHPTMLYLDQGLHVPPDSYTVPGLPDRSACKAVFNVMLNSKSWPEAYGAIERGEDLGTKFRRYIPAIRKHHPAIKFCTGDGLLLQNRDSHMAEQVILELIKRGVIALPVHDSFIVQAEHEHLLLSIMDEVLHHHFPRLSGLSNGMHFKITRRTGEKEAVPSRVCRQPPMKIAA